MYINLAWFPLNGTDPHTIEGEILGAFSSGKVKFVDFFTPFDGCFFASVDAGQTQKQVERLHAQLLPLSTNRFAYVITVSPNGQDLCRSADQTDPIYDHMVAFVT